MHCDDDTEKYNNKAQHKVYTRREKRKKSLVLYLTTFSGLFLKNQKFTNYEVNKLK